MQRETATEVWDLPHAFEADTKLLTTTRPAQLRCQCGREKADELHSAPTVERAAEVTPLERERGV